MKRILVVAVVVCMVFSLCVGEGFAKEKKPYLIGANMALTGYLSVLGIAMQKGMDIAIDDINASGGINGRELKVIYYNNESDPDIGLRNAKRLISIDKVVVLAANVDGPTAMAVDTLLEPNKIALISSAAEQSQWNPTRKWLFALTPRQKDGSIPILLNNAIDRGGKKIAYIYSDFIYGQEGLAVFKETMAELKMEPAAIEKYPMTTTDVAPQISHIIASGADTLLITGLTTDTAMVIKAARDQGFKGIIVCDYAVVSQDFIDLLGKYGEGIVSTSLKTLVAHELPDSDPQKKVAVAFHDKYAQKHGAFVLYAAHMYDQVGILAEALKMTDPELDPYKKSDLKKIRVQIRDNLEKVKGFVGQNGIYNLSAQNHNGLPPNTYVPVVIRDSQWHLYK